MRVLMFGWEFPPDNSGGLGTACLGLTKALVRQGTDVTFVLPFRPSSLPSFMRLLSSDLADVEFKTIYSPLTAYISAAAYQRITKRDTGGVYAPSLIEEVLR
ncbi:MAG: Glycosyl transferase, group 1 family, partial [Parcubacteria group bacterium GW2011_GWA2_47_8]